MKFFAATLLAGLAAIPGCVAEDALIDPNWRPADMFMQGEVFLVGHRGAGANLGEHTDQPIENTRESVRQAFVEGAAAVFVEAQQTLGGTIVAARDNALPDGRCVSGTTVQALRTDDSNAVGDQLRDILAEAKQFGDNQFEPSGLVVVELATPSSDCGSGGSSFNPRQYVGAVVEAVEGESMAEHVLLSSSSPTLLELAAELAPHVGRQLSLDADSLRPNSSPQVGGGVQSTAARGGGAANSARRRLPHWTTWDPPTYYASLQDFAETAAKLEVLSVGLRGNVLADSDESAAGTHISPLMGLLGTAQLQQELHVPTMLLPAYTVEEYERALMPGWSVGAICTDDLAGAQADLDLKAPGDDTTTITARFEKLDLDVKAPEMTTTRLPHPAANLDEKASSGATTTTMVAGFKELDLDLKAPDVTTTRLPYPVADLDKKAPDVRTTAKFAPNREMDVKAPVTRRLRGA